MKITRYITASAIFLLLVAGPSCKKSYLDTFPTTAVSAADALSSTSNAYAALNGIHRLMYIQYDQQGDAGEGSVNIFRDLLGEDIVYPLANGSTGLIGFVQWTNPRNINSVDVRFVYKFYYRIIANANILINGIDNVPGASDNDKKIIKGQALAYRAWAHFQLVQLWGKRYVAGAVNSQPGVPLMLSNTTEGQPRATVEEVYTQVNKDIDEAIVLLANYITRTGSAAKSNLNINVARGLKARIALTQQNWEVAATNAIAARSGFTLMTNAEYQSGFSNINNQEWIWGSRQADDQGTFFYSYFAYISCNFNSTVIRTQPRAINANLWNAIPVTDIRKKMWDLTGANVDVPRDATGPVGARVPYQNQKFKVPNFNFSIGDVPYMRAGEMYFIEAEARARQGGQDAAARTALYNVLINRNPSYVLSTNSGQALIDEIMLNRRVEFWGEGFRFLDLKRLNLPLNRNGIPNLLSTLASVLDIPAGDSRWEWLFPQLEINANPAIVQNP